MSTLSSTFESSITRKKVEGLGARVLKWRQLFIIAEPRPHPLPTLESCAIPLSTFRRPARFNRGDAVVAWLLLQLLHLSFNDKIPQYEPIDNDAADEKVLYCVFRKRKLK